MNMDKELKSRFARLQHGLFSQIIYEDIVHNTPLATNLSLVLLTRDTFQSYNRTFGFYDTRNCPM